MPRAPADPDASPRSSGAGGRSFGQRILSGAAWIAFGRVASVGTFFLSQVVLARTMETGQFAAYAVVISLAPVLAVLVGFGCPQILMRDMRRFLWSDAPQRAVVALRSCARLTLVSSIVLALACAVVAPYFGGSVKWSGLRDHTEWVVALSCVLGAGVVVAFALQGMDDFRTAVMVGSRRGGLIPNTAFLATIAVVWLTQGEMSLGFTLATQTALAALVLPMAWIAVKRRLPAPGQPLGSGTWTDDLSMRHYLRESWPLMLSQFTILSVDGLDVVWVAAFESGEAVAHYKITKDLVRLVAAPYLMFVMAMGPFTAELLEKQQLRRLERILRGSTTVVGIPMLAVCGFFILAPATSIRWTFGPEYESAARLLQILAAGQAVRVLLGPSGQSLVMAGMQRLNMIQTVLALLLYVVAAPLAMRHFGAMGAAVAYSIWIVFQGLAGLLLVQWKLGIWTAATASPAALVSIIRSVRELRGRRGRAEPVD